MDVGLDESRQDQATVQVERFGRFAFDPTNRRDASASDGDIDIVAFREARVAEEKVDGHGCVFPQVNGAYDVGAYRSRLGDAINEPSFLSRVSPTHLAAASRATIPRRPSVNASFSKSRSAFSSGPAKSPIDPVYRLREAFTDRGEQRPDRHPTTRAPSP